MTTYSTTEDTAHTDKDRLLALLTALGVPNPGFWAAMPPHTLATLGGGIAYQAKRAPRVVNEPL